MLVMLKELVNDEERDITINPREVLNIKQTSIGAKWCIVELVGGKEFHVKGTLQEITARLNSKRLLKG